MNCCSSNNCVEIVPSGCVQYTKDLIAFSRIGDYLSAYEKCDLNINHILGAVDEEIKRLYDYTLLPLSQIGSDCQTYLGVLPTETLASLTVTLANKICELKAELELAKAQELNIWKQVLPASIALQCFGLEDCEDEMTLELIIQKLIDKNC